ncbi:MAG: hypothetical protein EXR79_06705, partial [Myxococcales bacterium]|nr:hypothetical protein [Myxococcales bacterium]
MLRVRLPAPAPVVCRIALLVAMAACAQPAPPVAMGQGADAIGGADTPTDGIDTGELPDDGGCGGAACDCKTGVGCAGLDGAHDGDAAPVPDDGDPTQDGCPADAVCDDLCTGAGCADTVPCIPSQPDEDCDDHDPCTADQCVPDSHCVHVPIAGCALQVPYVQPFDCSPATWHAWTLDFEGPGMPAWSVDGSPPVAVAVAPFVSPECSLNFNGAFGLQCAPALVVSGRATAPWIDATEYKKGDPLYVRFRLAGTWGPADTLWLEVTTDGAKWHAIDGLAAVNVWDVVTRSLAPWAGQKFQLRLRFQSKACFQAESVGAFVDDFEVRAGTCKTTSMCDDLNPCTDDVCVDGECKAVQKAKGATCNDDNPCTGGDICKFGQCVGVPIKKAACDDGLVCTTGDQCEEGACSGAATIGPCNDGDPCTAGDHCDAGLCTGTLKLCSDGNSCTVDACDPHTGGCASAPAADAAPCKDGDVCTVDEACFGAVCRGRHVCDDDAVCTVDSCVPKTGGKFDCSYGFMPAGSPCNDADPCTAGDQCAGKVCKPSGPAPCSVQAITDFGCADPPAWAMEPPSDPTRTGWSIDATPAVPGATGCSLNFNDGVSFPCNPAEGTAAGSATSPPIALPGATQAVLRFRSWVDMGPAETQDVRWVSLSADGFQTAPVIAWLANGPAQGKWRTERIDLGPLAGKTIQARWRIDTFGCQQNGGAGWFVDDVQIVTNVAKPCGVDADCDDGKPCSIEPCKAGTCAMLYPSTECNDGNACTVGDVCDGLGSCVAGKPANCADASPCTADACDGLQGCTHVVAPDGTPCGGGKCAIAGACLGEVCLSLPQKCDDGNPCTTDSCDAGGVCKILSLQENAACDDGDPCTGSDACKGGKCSGPAAPCAFALVEPFACAGTVGWTFAGPNVPGAAKFAIDGTPAPPGHHSPSCALNLNDGVNFECKPGQPRVEASATSPAINLAGVTGAALWFWTWSDVGGFDNADIRLIEASSDGFKTVPLRMWLPNTQGGKKWRRIRVGLTGFAGQVVKVRFRFDSIDCAVNTGTGWFVDDIEVHVSPGDFCGKDLDCPSKGPCALAKCFGAKCSFSYGQAPCNDWDACTGLDQCNGAGVCGGGVYKVCSDGDPCTLDTCDPFAGCQSTKKGEGTPCNDGNECTAAETCKTGKCIGKSATDDTSCTNAEPCTFNDKCKAGLCVDGLTDVTGAICDDKNPCTGLDKCFGGKCTGGKSTCDDGEACTLDFCEVINANEIECGWKPAPDGGLCDDGDPCTGTDTCTDGACDGKALPCFPLLTDSFGCNDKQTWLVDLPVGKVGWKIDALPGVPGAKGGSGCSLNFNNDANLDAGPLLPKGGALSGPVVVPLKGVTALRFWNWFQGDPSAMLHPRFVEIVQGDTQAVLDSVLLDNAKLQGMWHKVRIPLAKFAGQKVRARFRFNAAVATLGGYPGWFIDDVAILTAQPATCTKDVECLDDPEPCIDAQCLQAACELVALPVAPCADDNACTDATTCQGGKCTGQKTDCDDGYACTADACNASIGCTHDLVKECDVVPLPYTITFTCGTPPNNFWLLDKPAQGPQWAMDGSPDPPGALSPDCSLNFNNGKDFQ